jgi:hypothetical protein
VNSQRTADRVAELGSPYSVVLRKDLDTVCQARALHWHYQLQIKMMDVNSAFPGQQRPWQKDPEMATSPAHFERLLHSVLRQVVL